MNEYKNIEKDYRKWILFNTLLSDFQNLYELYTAVDSRQSKAGVSFNEEFDEGETKFIVEQEGNDSTLEINGEANRKRFLEYLAQLYFPNQEIEEWYQTKVGAKEKSYNHAFSEQSTFNSNSLKYLDEFKIHSKESKYYNLRVFFSVCFYLIILGVVISSFLTSAIAGVTTIISIIMIVLFLAIRNVHFLKVICLSPVVSSRSSGIEKSHKRSFNKTFSLFLL